MAEIITGTTTGYVNNMPDNTLIAVQSTKDAVKDARYDVLNQAQQTAADLSKQIDAIDDTLSAAIHTVSRDTMDVRAQITAVGYQVRDGFTAAAKDAEINALKTQIDAAKNTTYLSDKIASEGDATRALINNINNSDLNRRLVERNAALVEALEGNRFWRDRADQGQWASLQSQIQAFGSNLQDTKNSLVNFGSMSRGAGNQSATSNNA